LSAQAFPRKYLYFSERRVRSWLDGSGVATRPSSSREITTPNLGNVVPSVKWTRVDEAQAGSCLAELFERTFDDWIVRDLGSPGPIRFAVGTGIVNFGEFVDDVTAKRALIHVDVNVDDRARRVAICMFGSLENYAEFIPRSTDPSPRLEHGWTSSAAPDIERFLSTRNVDGVVIRDREDLAREAVRVVLFQGDRGPYTDASRGYNRSFTYGETNRYAEWCAEIYEDVSLGDTGGGAEEGYDRVLIGAPMWVRTPSPDNIQLYSEHTLEENEWMHDHAHADGQVPQFREVPDPVRGKRADRTAIDVLRKFFGRT
jgi:hypothetical protein